MVMLSASVAKGDSLGQSNRHLFLRAPPSIDLKSPAATCGSGGTCAIASYFCKFETKRNFHSLFVLTRALVNPFVDIVHVSRETLARNLELLLLNVYFSASFPIECF